MRFEEKREAIRQAKLEESSARMIQVLATIPVVFTRIGVYTTWYVQRAVVRRINPPSRRFGASRTLIYF